MMKTYGLRYVPGGDDAMTDYDKPPAVMVLDSGILYATKVLKIYS